MKTYSLFARLGNRLAQPWRRFSGKRRGTVIIIVLALLGLLALIGFFAVSFTGQENQSATYFANNPTAKTLTQSLDPNAFFNDILRQIIIGPGVTEQQSVLWGGNKALVPTMFGRDLAPYNGFGVNQIWNGTTNLPTVDQNFDGLPDDGTGSQLDNRAFSFLNFSPAAAAPWQATTTYFTGSFVTPPGSPTGLFYVATTGGVSSGSAPSFPTSAGSTVTDNTVTWTAVSSIDFNNYPKPNTSYPEPDVNFTYPDVTSSFLASDTLVPNGLNNPVRVITPSFHRPMQLRNLVPSAQWYTSPITAPYVLYPHVYHQALDSAGKQTGIGRYVSNQFADINNSAAAWAASTAYTTGQLVNAGTPTNTYICTVAGTSGTTAPTWPTTTGGTVTDNTVVWTDTSLQPFLIPGDVTTAAPSEGVWTTSGAFNPVTPPAISYAVDTDNDGIPDSNYFDVGFPLMQDSNGNQFVAMAALKLIDADSLFNLNVHGNRASAAQVPVPSSFAGGTSGAPTTPGTFLSTSDHGVSASEVNLEWALNARPTATSADFAGTATTLNSALQPYTLFFRPGGSGSNPMNNFDATQTGTYGSVSFELANMEIWNLLNGRPQLAAGTPPTVTGSSFVGRWGENVTRLDPNVTAILAGSILSAGVSAASDPFPLPGTSGVDDNNNQLESGTFSDSQGVFHPAFVQPIDFFADGTWVTGIQGKQRQLLPGAATTAPMGNEQFPAYSQFFIAPTVGWANVLSAALVPGGGAKLLVDEPDETWTEPFAAAQQPSDSIFGASENAIQLSGGDFNTLGNPGRTASLMPFNFVSSARAALIRQRFTSTSWDLKSFGKEFFGPDPTGGVGPYDARRLWEFTDTSGSPPTNPAGPFRFPPNFVGTNGSLAPNLPPYTTITPYASAIDDATTTASGAATPSNTFAYPMRTAVSSLLQVLANPNLSSSPASGPYTVGALPQTNLIQPQRLLSVNGLTEMFQNGTDSNHNPIYQFRFRPLTPHPSTAVSTFASTPITPFPSAGTSITIPQVSWISEPEQLGASGGTPSAAYLANQEWLARYDRQRMARDIYTLLYLTGGGADTPNLTPVAALNYATTPNQPNPISGVRPLYTDDQLAEMAQFAANLVDALDPDSNITVFEYDKDLSDGWNLDDNAYDSTHDPIITTHPLDRGVVYGIERQQICLNESMVTLYQPCISSLTSKAQGHPDIQWDNSPTLSRQWSCFYTELENVGPVPINFNNAQWQITVKQSPAMTAMSPYYGTGVGTSGEMRMTLVGSNVQSSSTLPTLAAGAATGGNSPRLTIGGMIGSGGTPQTNLAIAGPPYNFVNPNPANPAVPAPSYMVIDPNDATGTPGTQSNSTTFNYMYPIAPRAAYGTGPTATVASPWFGNTTILAPASNGLDLIDPNQVNNYWIVPPNTTSPNADGTPVSSTPIAAGAQLTQFNDSTGVNLLPSTAPLVLRIELRRRVDLNRAAILPSSDPTGVQAADNPWITVDYMDVPVNVMALKITGVATDFSVQLQGQLGGYYNATARAAYQAAGGAYYPYSFNSAGGTSPNVSTERSQPLYHDYQLNPFNPASTNPTTPSGPFVTTSAVSYPRNGGANTLTPPTFTGTSLWQGNSLGQDNDAAGFNPGTNPGGTAAAIAPHPLYQPHYDRDFTSIGELFNIPLYGQPQTPQWFPNATYALGSTIVPLQPPSVPGATGVGGLVFVCTSAGTGATSGTSGGSEPTWPTSQGATIGDGQLTWTAGPAAQMFTGLTHVMGSRVPEPGTTVLPATAPNYTPELLVGTDYIPNDATVFPRVHYVGYGTAGFRLQHPEGGDQTNPYPNNPSGTSDFTENRWFRALGFLEVPTRSHRGIDEPTANWPPYQIAAGSINGSLGFFRTPGKINLNTLRYPDIVAGLVGEPDIFNMNFTPALPSGVNLPANLSIPYLLQDITGSDTVASPPPQNPLLATSTPRDWWEQFIATRDGVDPLPIANGGTGLSIPGLPRAPDGVVPPTGLSVTPGSHPFRGMGYSAYGGVDLNGYNGPLESNLLRSLPGDAVTTGGGTFDLRRRLFELGTNTEHLASRDSSGALPAGLDYATKQRLLARLAGNTTTRSNVFFVWIQVDFFQAKDVGPSLTPADTGVVRIGQKLATSPGYRGFFVIDRSQALSLMAPQYVPTTTAGQPFVFSTNQSFNWQSLVLFRQRIQ